MAQLVRSGLRTALICSAPFLELGRTQARTLGVPALPLIVIPHPLGGIAIDEVRTRAQVALPEIVRLLRETRP